MASRAWHAVRFAMGWASFALLWLLFAGSLAWPELGAGAFAATLAMLAMRSVEFARLTRFAPRARWLAVALWLPWYAVSGTWEIIVVLARHLLRRPSAPSLLFAARYRANGEDAAGVTLRALAITMTTITPNFVVIEIDRDRGLLLFHQLRESAIPRMTRALGADG